MPPTGPPLSVLVADPCPDNAESLAAVLALSGHRVRTAHTGATAFALAAADPPDVVITEALFLDLDGFALPGRLTALPVRPHLILLTTNPALADRARAAGFDRHYVKPADPRELIGAVVTARVRRPGPLSPDRAGAPCTTS